MEANWIKSALEKLPFLDFFFPDSKFMSLTLGDPIHRCVKSFSEKALNFYDVL